MMRKAFSILNMLTLCLVGLSCEEPSTEKEISVLVYLNNEYGSKYRFDTTNRFGAFYLRIYAVNTVNEDEIIEIDRKYVSGKYPKIRWSYVNVYDKNQNFLYQLTYDPHIKGYSKSYREYR